MKRIACISDPHCGHSSGLTPPAWQWPTVGGPEDRNRSGEIQCETWERYGKIVKARKPVDALFVVGDCIDGRETGRLLVTQDREDQVEMAYECIRLWNAPEVIMVHGTRKHTGKLEKWERLLAAKLKAEIGAKQFVEIGGVSFCLRHKMSRSSIPHGRGTPLAKEAVWNELKAARKKEPKADVHLFGHVHYYHYCGGNDWLAMTLPGLQAATEYGLEEVSGDVDWGVVWFDVENGAFDWGCEIVKVVADKPEVIHL